MDGQMEGNIPFDGPRLGNEPFPIYQLGPFLLAASLCQNIGIHATLVFRQVQKSPS